MGPTGGVSTGHPLTSAAAFSILLKGGNAFDAGVAALLAGGVLEQDLYSLGGEALVLVYPKSERKVTAVVGQGWAPAAVNVDWYLSRQKTLKGEGLDPAVTPGALHAALTVLEKWGTRSFEEVATPAIEYAEKGFPIRPSTVRAIQNQQRAVRELAGQPEVLVEAGRLGLRRRRDRQAAEPGAHAAPHGRSRTQGEEEGTPRRHRRGTRSLLQRRYRARDGEVPPAARSAVRATRTSRSSSRASKRPRRPRIAATRSTNTASAARGRCCCRR